VISLGQQTCTNHQRGFTLVEIMVAMVIGMLGIIIMMQMFSLFEGQKRSTTGGNDAQNSGAIALFGLQQDIEQAGYCAGTGAFTNIASAVAAGATITLSYTGDTLSPVMLNYNPISAVADANTNTLVVTYGNDSCPPQSASGVSNAANLNVLAYAVRNGNLMQCDYVANNCAVPANWSEIAAGIVSMRAECNANQAVRVALITRSSQLEKDIVTPNPPQWGGAGAINLAGTNGTVDTGYDWQHYRYKVFETLVPIRNSIRTGFQGC
jgi:type IV pilus assembly protein PilW